MCLFLPVIVKIRRSVYSIFSISLLAGILPEFNETFSFSRTICFYGYFLLGYYSGKETLEKIRRNKKAIVISGIIIMVIIYAYCISGVAGKAALTGILTKGRSYKNIGMNIMTGIITRAAGIPISIVLGMLVIAVTPDKKNIFTNAGKNSIIILIFHEYFVLAFWKTAQILQMKIDTVIEIILLVIIAVIITLFLSMDIFQRLYRKIMGKMERMALTE
jgi:fucose 4-O-acetylase-like acetyltransferase